MAKRRLTEGEISARVEELQEAQWDERWETLRDQILENFEKNELDDLTTSRLEELQESEAEALWERIAGDAADAEAADGR